MNSRVAIQSNSTSIEIGPLENDYISIKFHSDGVQVEARPYLYTDGQYLAQFFQALANDWKGWNGGRTWKSIEGDLQFEAFHNMLSDVNLQVTLKKQNDPNCEWEFNGALRIDPGKLEFYAKSIKELFT